MAIISASRPSPFCAMSSSRPRKGLTKYAPALAASSAWAGENTSVTLVRIPSSRSNRTAWIPAGVMGTLTTMFGCQEASSRASRSMPSVSVETTSALTTPPLSSSHASRISSRNGRPSRAARVGLVVMPSSTPSAVAWRISSRLAVSRKIFMTPPCVRAGALADYMPNQPRRQAQDDGCQQARFAEPPRADQAERKGRCGDGQHGRMRQREKPPHPGDGFKQSRGQRNQPKDGFLPAPAKQQDRKQPYTKGKEEGVIEDGGTHSSQGIQQQCLRHGYTQRRHADGLRLERRIVAEAVREGQADTQHRSDRQRYTDGFSEAKRYGPARLETRQTAEAGAEKCQDAEEEQRLPAEQRLL